jgi:prepilin-type N-terminal cleavage/methylation domain-containing protein
MPKRKKGLTLVEMLVALAIMGVLLVPVSMIFYSGYSNYYNENDDMISIQKSREVMDSIIEGLRMYENISTTVMDEGSTLYIKEGLVFNYIPAKKMLYKNGTPLFMEQDPLIINDFHVEEIKPENYDSTLISISLRIKLGKGEEIVLENSYRRKTS